MSRLKRGQVNFAKLLPLRTCHDIRSWRPCAYCLKPGSVATMIEASKDNFWHGRCFERKFGMERMLEMPRKELVKLSLGDLGVDLMKELLAGADLRA